MFARSRITSSAVLRRASVFRHRRDGSTWQKLPRTPRLLAIGLIAAGGIGLATGLYKYYQIPPSPYPEQVTKHLRKALYYEGAGSDPKQAIQCYLQALEEATLLGLDQTSDKMTGLKIKIGAVYENSGRLDSAIRVYSGLLNEIKSALKNSRTNEEDHTRLIRRALGTSVKIGDLSIQVPSYSEQTEPAYVWALETMLQESKRRKGDTSWLELEAQGGLYESLANFYFAAEKFQLALPLYLKSIETIENANCHTITLMNNIASAISSQSSTLQVQENAADWATRARDLKVPINSERDKEECNLGRCSALFNLGMIMEKSLKYELAKANYLEALSRARNLQRDDGRVIQEMASQGLERISSKAS